MGRTNTYCIRTYARWPPLQVGDASGVQSPLSFGGFGALTRHVGRITSGVSDALGADMLTRSDLGAMATYQPNLRAAWLFQARHPDALVIRSERCAPSWHFPVSAHGAHVSQKS